jgi:hypothetical protein
MQKLSTEKLFWLDNGKSVASLNELAEILPNMDDKTFQHHVTIDKNDFSNWINDVFGKKSLGKLIKTAKDKLEMSKIINLSFKKKIKPKIIKITHKPKKTKIKTHKQNTKTKKTNNNNNKLSVNENCYLNLLNSIIFFVFGILIGVIITYFIYETI